MPLQVSKAKGGKYRKEFIRQVILEDNEIDRLLGDLESEYTRVVGRGEQIINDTKINKAALVLMASYILALGKIMKSNNKKVGEITANSEYDRIAPYLKGFAGTTGILNLFRQSARKIPGEIEKGLLYRKLPNTINSLSILDSRTVLQRLDSVKISAMKTIRNLTNKAITLGWSREKLAGRISLYLDPRGKIGRVTPWVEHRLRFGRPTSFLPKDIRAGSVWSNSMMIARTEMNNTWRKVTVDLNKNKPWHAGWNWVLSSSHPKPDICDDWAAGSPYKDEGELPVEHPNGFCYVEPMTVSKRDFNEYLDSL